VGIDSERQWNLLIAAIDVIEFRARAAVFRFSGGSLMKEANRCHRQNQMPVIAAGHASMPIASGS
jgi:hypothetical protein